MAKYLIHSCKKRQWYVDEFLVPSMIEQGIRKQDIAVYQDRTGEGNLRAFLRSCQQIIDLWGTEVGVWHLQDDVLICRDFKKRTEELDNGLVCGFTCSYDAHPIPGLNDMKDIWWSFPCTRIPNAWLKDFLAWVQVYVWRDHQFDSCTKHNKGDDYIWRAWVVSYKKNEKVYCCSPTLVEHIDYMLGGSYTNPARAKTRNVRSIYWEDEELVRDLERRINDLHNRTD